MTEINIPDIHIQEIKKMIQDDAVKREFGYGSVQDYIIDAIESDMEAVKDCVGIPID